MKKFTYLLLVISTIILSCKKYPGKIEGFVREISESGYNPVKGAKITLTPTQLSVETDDRGYFAFMNLTPDIYNILSEKTGYFAVNQNIIIEEGITYQNDMTIEKIKTKGNLSGFVTDGTYPISSARISSPSLDTIVFTDMYGVFFINDIPTGYYSFTISRENYIPVQVVVNIEENTLVQTSIKLNPELYISIIPEAYKMSRDRDSVPFWIVSNTNWKYECKENWLKIRIEDSIGYKKLYAITTENIGAEPRTAVITLSATGAVSKILTITQYGSYIPYLVVFPTSLAFMELGATLNISLVNAGTGILSWNMTENIPWLTLTEYKGATDNSKVIDIIANVDRNGVQVGEFIDTIFAKSNGGDKKIVVTMTKTNRPYLSVFPLQLSYFELGEKLNVTMANAGIGILSWNFVENISWLTIPTSASGSMDNSASMDISVNVNRTGLNFGEYIDSIKILSNGGNRSIMVSLTNAAKPIVNLYTPTLITYTSAVLKGDINPAAKETEIFIDYGPTSTYNQTVKMNQKFNGTIPQLFSFNFLGLRPGQTTHYRIRAINSMGETTTLDNIITPPSTMQDIEGNTYNVVMINNQILMKDNLKVSVSNTNSPITSYVYNNNLSFISPYGRLYDWNSARLVCPTGWHLPSDTEWKNLESFLGMPAQDLDLFGQTQPRGTDQGGKLKQQSTTTWIPPNFGATNISGFTALPGGQRNASDGTYIGLGSIGLYWTSTENGIGSAWMRGLTTTNALVNRNHIPKQTAISVRCLKD